VALSGLIAPTAIVIGVGRLLHLITARAVAVTAVLRW
jgi:hypothetical protein